MEYDRESIVANTLGRAKKIALESDKKENRVASIDILVSIGEPALPALDEISGSALTEEETIQALRGIAMIVREITPTE